MSVLITDIQGRNRMIGYIGKRGDVITTYVITYIIFIYKVCDEGRVSKVQ